MCVPAKHEVEPRPSPALDRPSSQGHLSEVTWKALARVVEGRQWVVQDKDPNRPLGTFPECSLDLVDLVSVERAALVAMRTSRVDQQELEDPLGDDLDWADRSKGRFEVPVGRDGSLQRTKERQIVIARHDIEAPLARDAVQELRGGTKLAEFGALRDIARDDESGGAARVDELGERITNRLRLGPEMEIAQMDPGLGGRR